MSTLLKLCGNHSINDVQASSSSSAHYIGFVFAKSKRQVTNDKVKKWLQQVGDLSNKQLVALFVHAKLEEIEEAIEGIPFDVIQCHGNETVDEVIHIKERINLPVWKVIHHHEQAIEYMKTFQGVVDGYVIDCKVGDQWGGTGVSFDWQHAPDYIQEGKKQEVPVFIAGGIKPNNVSELLRYNPDGIDVSSGIECNGQKSIELIRQLEERMKNDGGELSR